MCDPSVAKIGLSTSAHFFGDGNCIEAGNNISQVNG